MLCVINTEVMKGQKEHLRSLIKRTLKDYDFKPYNLPTFKFKLVFNPTNVIY